MLCPFAFDESYQPNASLLYQPPFGSLFLAASVGARIFCANQLFQR